MTEELVPIFRVSDGRRAAQWYARLGFVVEGEHRFAPELPLYLFLRRGSNALHLSEHLGDARPNTLVYFYVDDVAAIAAEFGAPIIDQPWAEEVQLTDPDGNRLRIGQRRVEPGRALAIDPASYALGIIAAFSEVVAAGVKRLALSEPATPGMMRALLPEARRIAERHGVLLHLEDDLIKTDLFPEDVATGMHVLLIYRGDVLERYLALKEERAALVAHGAHIGGARRDIAVRFGQLLSYSDARIHELLERR